MKSWVVFLSALFFIASVSTSLAQKGKPVRIGVLTPGGALYETLEGVRLGLKESSWEEGKHFVLEIKDIKGDLTLAEQTAKNLEKDGVNLIYALTTPVIAKAKAATSRVPIVFSIGSDPVVAGLVDSFARPGGRLTGVHYLARDLTAKRLEVLKEILPKLTSVITFYDPTNRVASEGATMARTEAKRTGIRMIERHVRSVNELKNDLQKYKAGEADAFLFTPDPMIGSEFQSIIDTAKAKKLPTMFQEQSLVRNGALVSYGQNYHEIGRLSAKYIQRVITGTPPRDMKIETVDSVELALNLQTAKQLGITVPPQVLARAQEVIR